MKLFKVLGAAGLLLAAAGAQGATQHFAVTVSGVLSTQLEAGNVVTIQRSPVTNATILNGLIQSGNANGATRASDLDIVISDVMGNFFVSVIKKVDNSIVSGLANNGSNYVQTGFLAKLGKSFVSQTTIGEGYLVALPNIAEQTVNMETRVLINTSSGSSVVTNLSMSFLGGSGTQGNGATTIQGTMRKAHKVYDF